MIQSILVYSLLLGIMLFFAFVASKKRSYYILSNGILKERSFVKFEIIFPIVLFAIVFGMRYDVGVDHLAYLRRYVFGIQIQRHELLFVFITNLCANLQLHYIIYFSILAFIQAFFFFYAFKKENFLYPFLVFFLFTNGEWLSWMNLMRQAIAICIWIFSLKYIVEKKLWLYVLWVTVAFLFHRSAIVLFIFYPILRSGNDYFKSIILQLILFVLAFVFREVFFDVISKFDALISFYLELMGRDMYEMSYNLERLLTNFKELKGTGYAAKFRILIIVIIILYSSRLKKFYNSRWFNTCYFFFFIGIIAMYIFPSGAIAIDRPFEYFYIFQTIMYAYFAHYLFSTKKYDTQFMYYALIIAFIGIFYLNQVVTSSNDDAACWYQFYFQKHAILRP